MRKLATIQRIWELKPIEGADNIEVASVLGWKCVVRKGEFQVGDLCVYIEVDAIVPDRPEFEFLKKSKFRVKTIKLRGQISQGLAMPLGEMNPHPIPTLGDDVTSLLGITQFEQKIPVGLGGDIKGVRPRLIPKTDEERIQNIPELLEIHKGKDWYATEKLDGSSFTAYLIDGVFGLCSRNMDLDLTSEKNQKKNAFVKAAKACEIEQALMAWGADNVAVQGELVGPGIQKNRYALDKHYMAIFSVYDIATARYHVYQELVHIMSVFADWDNGGYAQNMVPIVHHKIKLPNTVEGVLGLAKGSSILNPKIQREGLVFRRIDRHVSFKAVNVDYLLKHGE